jgi:4-carboxymuconolactone decarboxylase
MTAMAQERLPTILPDQYTAEQKKAAEDFPAARNVPVWSLRAADVLA